MIQKEKSQNHVVQLEKWSILSNVEKYVQSNQYPISFYKLEVKAPEEGHGSKMYKSYRIVKDISRK